MTFEDALEYGKGVLQDADVSDCELDAWYLMEYACKVGRSWYYAHNTEEMGKEKFLEYELLLRKRAERVPLQYITGCQEFMGLEFKVNSHVLIPRQDTETLVEEAVKVLEPGMEVLDLCTGSGCVIISLLKQRQLKGTASDVSKQALLIAKENARNNQVEVELVRSNLFQNITGKYDMIISNPPYIPTGVIATLMPEVKNFEPVEALDGGEDGLDFYRGGRVAFLMEENGYRNVRVMKDLAGNDRVVRGNLPSVR